MRAQVIIIGGLSLCGLLTAAAWQQGLLNRAPPTISAALPSPGLQRGEVQIALSVTATPALRSLTAQLDDHPPRPLAPGTETLSIDTTALPDGPHQIVVTAVDGSWSGNRSVVTVALETDNTFPALSIAEGSLTSVQGQTLALYLRPSEPVTLSGELLGKPRTFYEVEPGLFRALVGIPIESEVGWPPLRLAMEDAAGNRTLAELPIRIEAGSFPAGGTIRLTAEQRAARQDDQNRAKTRKEREDVYRLRLDAPQWSSVLQRPIEGRRTSAFGRYRTYSDGRRSHHSGTDLASPTGTPVAAAAAGLVRLAGWQHIFGNVVIIDHGQGVSTSYNHLSSVAVSVGDLVATGDVVGAVGSTGQSTGPHLHWGLVVDGVAVDAEQWLVRSFLPDEFVPFTLADQIEGGAVWPDDALQDR